MSDNLNNTLIEELITETDSTIVDFADFLVNKLPYKPLGVIFYGSVLRENNYDGILDFYIITKDSSNFSSSFLGRISNKLLPPNVYYIEKKYATFTLRAKVAILSYSQFLKRSTLESNDTTIWARFCQPVRLVWVRDCDAADNILKAIRQSVITASCWAALLGPHSGTALEYWNTLFSCTYKVELRVEKKNRSQKILDKREERYKKLLFLSWKHVSLRSDICHSTLKPHLSFKARKKARKKWEKIENIGKILNILRLLKAAFTFSDGIAYLIWKINRHTGEDIRVSSFEKKHPILGLPILLWRMRGLKRFIRK